MSRAAPGRRSSGKPSGTKPSAFIRAASSSAARRRIHIPFSHSNFSMSKTGPVVVTRAQENSFRNSSSVNTSRWSGME